MSLKNPSPQDKLAVLERLLEREKREGDEWNASILSATCKAIRLEMPDEKQAAIDAISRHVEAVLRSKNALGYSQDRMVGLAQEFIGRWPLIEKALRQYREEA